MAAKENRPTRSATDSNLVQLALTIRERTQSKQNKDEGDEGSDTIGLTPRQEAEEGGPAAVVASTSRCASDGGAFVAVSRTQTASSGASPIIPDPKAVLRSSSLRASSGGRGSVASYSGGGVGPIAVAAAAMAAAVAKTVASSSHGVETIREAMRNNDPSWPRDPANPQPDGVMEAGPNYTAAELEQMLADNEGGDEPNFDRGTREEQNVRFKDNPIASSPKSSHIVADLDNLGNHARDGASHGTTGRQSPSLSRSNSTTAGRGILKTSTSMKRQSSLARGGSGAPMGGGTLSCSRPDGSEVLSPVLVAPGGEAAAGVMPVTTMQSMSSFNKEQTVSRTSPMESLAVPQVS